jgi:arylsulfatase A-like enzyme
MSGSRIEELNLPRSRRRVLVATALAVLAGVLCVAGCTKSPSLRPLPSPATTGSRPSPAHPNIVFVLTDDLSWDLVKYMPHVRALQQQGMTFDNYTVTDSLCCPSRASIFTGKYPHNTHVLGNTLPNGGFYKFRAAGDDRSTFATSLLAEGYRTAFMGKYLNDYNPAHSRTPIREAVFGPYVPPGWSTWDGVGAGGYGGYDYGVSQGNKLVYYGHKPSDFANTVLQSKATAFVASATTHPNPFMLEVAPFSPHSPYTPAPADVGTFAGLQEPQNPNFDTLPHPAPSWLKARHLLAPSALAKIREWYEMRVEAVQSVDRMLGAIEHSVQAAGQAQNTVYVFSSDNGFHLGQYTLESGKQTAFDTDIRVPLIVAGPGIPADSTNSDMAQNIDLRPTFEQLAGAATPSDVDGRSLVPLLDRQANTWRTYALVEHAHDDPKPGDPDSQTYLSGTPPTYNALRTKSFVFIRYTSTGEIEFYNLAKDPYELHNLGPSLSSLRTGFLNHVMNQLIACHGSASCWNAGVPSSE